MNQSFAVLTSIVRPHVGRDGGDMNFNAAALQLMLDKGLCLADVVAIASANERRADPTAAERKRRQRARERDMSRRDDTGVTPSPNERDNLTPTREKPKAEAFVKKTKKPFRLPANWEPQPVTGKAAGMVACWQAGEMERELAKFKNYWRAKGANAAHLDWQATWVNWLITADERKARDDGKHPGISKSAAAYASLTRNVSEGELF